MDQWKDLGQKTPSAAPPLLAVLSKEQAALDDTELTLRLGALLCARPDLETSPEAAWNRRWRALQPHLEAHLFAKGTTLKAYVQQLNSGGDTLLAERVRQLK